MWYIPAGICFGGLLVGVWISLRYRRDVQAARKRVEASSRMIETKCGRIEYGDAGHGKPVLLIHGAGGDYDQGLLLGDLVLGEGFRLIAPSRFGYLQSPVRFFLLACHPCRTLPAAQPAGGVERAPEEFDTDGDGTGGSIPGGDAADEPAVEWSFAGPEPPDAAECSARANQCARSGCPLSRRQSGRLVEWSARRRKHHGCGVHDARTRRASPARAQ